MNPHLRKALKISSWAMVGAVLLLALLLYGVRLVGLVPYTVLSPSMEPDYPTGALIYLKNTDPSTLQIGDVITFRLGNNTTATHRIVELVPDEQDPAYIRYRTKGDNNKTVDGTLVEPTAIVGKAVFCVPYLGYLAQYMQKTPGSYVVIIIGLIVIAYVVIVDIITEEPRKKTYSEEGAVQNEES